MASRTCAVRSQMPPVRVSGTTTVTATVSAAERPPASVTRRVNVSTTFAVSPVGAAKVVVAAAGVDSVTVASPVCIHAY